MKTILLTLLLLGVALNLPAQQLRYVLDETRNYIVPCHPNVTTTIEFPSEILALNGKGFTSNPKQTPGVFLVGFSPGSRMVSVSPLTDRDERNLNVVVDGKTIVLDFLPVPQENAKGRIQFVESVAAQPPVLPAEAALPAAKNRPTGVRRTDAPPVVPARAVPPDLLISAMDIHKFFLTQSPQDLAEVVRLVPNIVMSLKDDSDVTDNGAFKVRLHSVVLHTKLDILTFAVEIEAGSENVRLNPEGVHVRVGSRVWRAVTADVSPELPAGTKQLAFFVLAGTKQGTLSPLWPENKFEIFINQLGAAANESRLLFEDETHLREKESLRQPSPSTLRKVRVDEFIPNGAISDPDDDAPRNENENSAPADNPAQAAAREALEKIMNKPAPANPPVVLPPSNPAAATNGNIFRPASEAQPAQGGQRKYVDHFSAPDIDAQ